MIKISYHRSRVTTKPHTMAQNVVKCVSNVTYLSEKRDFIFVIYDTRNLEL